jgi:hypothetical protein
MLSSDEIRMIRRNGWRRRKLIRHRLVDRHPFCFYCARPITRDDSTLDQVIPLVAGGADDESNFVVSCRWCNQNKGNHGLEFLACPTAPTWGLYNPKDVPNQIAKHTHRIKQRQIERKAAQNKWKKRNPRPLRTGPG